MKRGFWLIFAALAMIAAIVLFRYDPEPVAAIEATPPPADQPAAVRVSHEFVTVEIPTPPARTAGPPSATRPRAVLATHSESTGPREVLRTSSRDTRPTARPAPRDESLLERAGRAFVGDGKYRPQPFPRIKDNSPNP